MVCVFGSFKNLVYPLHGAKSSLMRFYEWRELFLCITMASLFYCGVFLFLASYVFDFPWSFLLLLLPFKLRVAL